MPVRVHLPPEACPAEGITLETVRQDSEGDHEQEPFEPCHFSQTASLDWKTPNF